MDEETKRQILEDEMYQRRIEAKIDDYHEKSWLRRWLVNAPPHYWDVDEEEDVDA